MKQFYLIAGLVLALGFAPQGAYAEHAHHAMSASSMSVSSMSVASTGAQGMLAKSGHDHVSMAPQASSHPQHAAPAVDCMNGHCPACFVEGSSPDQDSPFDMCGSCFMDGAPVASGFLVVSTQATPELSSIPAPRYEPPPDLVPAFQPAAPSFSLPVLHSVLRL